MINTFRNVAGYKVNLEKAVELKLCVSRKHAGKEIMAMFPLTTAPKSILEYHNQESERPIKLKL